MTTVSDLISTLKQNPALLDSIARLVDLATSPSQGLYREHEANLLRAARSVSCTAQEVALTQLSTSGPKDLIHQGQRFERTSRSSKTYTSLDGPVRVERDLYTCRQTGERFCPFEARAGIVEHALTPAAARLELLTTSCQDYRRAEQFHQTCFVCPRSKSAMHRDLAPLGDRIEVHLEELESTRREKLEPIERVHAVSVSIDRTGLPFEEPKKKPRGRPKKGAPKKPCEVKHRQTYCASLTLHDEKGQALSTQRFSGLPQEGDRIVEDARHSLERLLEHYPQAKLVQLCDGAEEMQRRGAQILEGYEVEEQLVDAWHAASYVRQACKAAGHAEDYGKELVRRLLKNKTGVDELITRLSTMGGCARQPEAVTDALRYLKNHREQMRYARARSKGLPIGSGAVEATCKCVVAVRFKRAGARWKARGAYPLLKLRAWLTSDQDVWTPVTDALLDSYVVELAA